MSTIEELLATPQVEEVWEVDNRYVINSSYSDDQGPIEIVGKDIGDMSSQISIQGESISQYVEFIMPRYYDNIDLSEKNIVIHYTAGDRGGENAPINVYKSQERIKFGWAIPASATANEGTLSIGVWARGYVGTEEYMWKSRIAYYKVERGPVLGEGLSEPDVQWYLDFVREMDAKVTEASLYSTRAKQSENVAVESKESAIVSSQAASDSANTAVQKAAEASSSASAASAHSAAAKVSADNAKESETKAQGYAEEARNNAEGFEPISDMMTGESPTATNSTNAPLVRLKVKGKTEQFTTTGRNKLKVEDTNNHWQCTVTVSEDGKATLTNTATSGVVYANLGSFSFKANKTYTISVKNAVNLRNYTFLKKGTLESANIAYASGNVTVTPTENIDTDLVVYMNDISTTGKTTSLYIQIEEGSTASAYEPFTNGASPNPDYPQEINGLAKDGAIEVKTCGKNLYNTEDRIVGVITDGGVISIASGYYRHTPIKVLPNTNYTLSANNETNIGGGYVYAFYTKQHKFIKVIAGLNTVSSHTFTTPANCYYVYLNDNIETDRKYQLEVGDTATPYEPYTETTTAIPTDAPLYEGDYIEIYADGSGKLVRAMAEVVFDGSADEVWLIQRNKDSENTICFRANSNVGAKSGAVICNKLVNTSVANADIEGINNSLGSLNYEFIISINKARLSTLDSAGLNTWLQSNPVTVVYELAEPTETPLTAEQVAEFKKLYTFEPVTNVLCDGEVEMIYFRNNPNGRVAGMLQRQIDSITSTLSSTEEV